MNCLICGKEFEIATTRGMKPKYCSIECKKVGMDNSRKKYIDKMKKKKAEEKFKADIEARTVEPEDFRIEINRGNDERYIRKDEVIFRKEDASMEAVKYVSDVVDLGRKLGAILFEAKELKEKINKEQSNYDKIGHEILQYYESPREITVETAIEIAQKAGNMRTPRRDIKVISEIIDGLTKGIPYNPPAYVAKAIQNKERKNEYYANQKEAIKG